MFLKNENEAQQFFDRYNNSINTWRGSSYSYLLTLNRLEFLASDFEDNAVVSCLNRWSSLPKINNTTIFFVEELNLPQNIPLVIAFALCNSRPHLKPVICVEGSRILPLSSLNYPIKDPDMSVLLNRQYLKDYGLFYIYNDRNNN